MMRTASSSLLSPLVVVGAAGLLTCSCSESEKVGADAGGGYTDQQCLDMGGSAGRCEGLCRPGNDAFCEAAAASIDCANLEANAPGSAIDVCGVPLKTPTGTGGAVAELKRSSGVDEYGGSGPPDLSCFSPGAYPAKPDPANSQNITMRGFARIFSNGCESNALDIEVWTVTSDGQKDQMVASSDTPAECKSAALGEQTITDECDPRWECSYAVENVPTEKELIVLTYGQYWAELYDYGVFIRNDDVASGEWEHDVRALANDDYTTIPQVAMGKTVTPGRGVMAGEVHDCGVERLINAVVDVDAQKFMLTYFDDNEDGPLPVSDAKTTSGLGLYAALDIKPGPITIAAAGVVDGQLVVVGFQKARIYADAVTSVTFRGLKPFQVP